MGAHAAESAWGRAALVPAQRAGSKAKCQTPRNVRRPFKRKEVKATIMARKKSTTTVTEEKPAISLEELKKKLVARGKTRGSLTYEEINLAFDALDDISPDVIDEFFEELTAM